MTHRIAIAKIGKDAQLSTDPNDFVFHSDYNTFKIIAVFTKNITLAASTSNQTFTQAHGLSFTPLVRGFAKESTLNKVFVPNSENVSFWSVTQIAFGSGVKFNSIESDATNIYINFDNDNGSSRDVSVRLFCLENISITPGTPNNGTYTGKRIIVAKSGFNALTEQNPNNLKFSSQYGTLKYYAKADEIVFLNAATAINQEARLIVNHNLGYYPYVEAFVRVYIGTPAGDFEPCPFFGSGATILYDAKYIITQNTLELYTKINGISGSLWEFEFILFVYRNNLNL